MKKFLVYWMNGFTGSTPGYSTPQVKSDFMDFETLDKADIFQKKLCELKKTGGTYRGRSVVHVSFIQHVG